MSAPSQSNRPVDDRFELTQKLGEGAGGEAWRARDRVSGSECVVKLMQKSLVESASMLERFRREVLALGKLEHPHVVRLLTAGTCATRGQPYYVMGWSPGVPLDVLLGREGRLSPWRALRLVDQLLSVLELGASRGVLHRDLKPANLLLESPGPEEHLRVLDFGLAKHLRGGEQTLELLTQGIVGTPLYLAPEQCRGAKVTAKTDVYATGCILMEVLTGEPPFTARKTAALLLKHVRRDPPTLDSRWAEAPAALVELLARCLAKGPDERPTASEARRVIQAVAATLPEAAAHAPAPTAPPVVSPTRVPAASPSGQLSVGPWLGTSTDPVPDSGAALRISLELEHAGMLAAADVFIGTRLKVGDGGEGIDLRLPGQATVLVTADGLAVSGGAARLDGVPLDVAAALSERFELGLGDRVSLEGVVLGPSLTPGPFPENRVAALRLEGKGSSVRATLLLGSASLGSGENDCLRLRYPGVLPGHVRIAPWRGGCAIAPGTGLATVVGQGPLTESLLLVPGLEIELGTLVLRVA